VRYKNTGTKRISTGNGWVLPGEVGEFTCKVKRPDLKEVRTKKVKKNGG